jgi:hypothetical protein
VAPGADWEIGSRFLYVRPLATETTRPRALVRIPLAGGAAEPVSPPLAGLHLAGLGLSLAPDESFLLFGRVDGDDSDLVLAEPVTPPSR